MLRVSSLRLAAYQEATAPKRIFDNSAPVSSTASRPATVLECSSLSSAADANATYHQAGPLTENSRPAAQGIVTPEVNFLSSAEVR